jgi:DNA repair exonuclease SbcCD ATPase subunit
MRVSKALVWISNKHFVLEPDSHGGVKLRDTSSNGTWVNSERVVKDVPRSLATGDTIELAAEEQPGEHRQVFFQFFKVDDASQPSAEIITATTSDPAAFTRAAVPGIAPPPSSERPAATATETPAAATEDDRTPTETLVSSLPGPQPERAGSPTYASAAAERFETLRARAEQAEAELAALREASAADSARLRLVTDELRQMEEAAVASHARLATVLGQHESELQRLTEYASEASQERQRVVQEKLAEAEAKLQAERRADAALRQYREADAALAAERTKSNDAIEDVKRLTEETSTLRSRLATIDHSLQQLARMSRDLV